MPAGGATGFTIGQNSSNQKPLNENKLANSSAGSAFGAGLPGAGPNVFGQQS